MCQAFLHAGARVVCAEIDESFAETLPREVYFLKADVASPEDCRSVASTTAHKFGKIDILINNAALQPSDSYTPLHRSDDTLVNRIIAVNLLGYRNMAKAVIPFMIEQSSGAIVNLGSVQGHQTARGVDPYGVTKAANIAQARQWAIEYARCGIRVNSISPGAIRTPLVSMTISQQGGELALANRHPIGRIGEPEEVAQVALFLASSAASFITGTDLAVDGGLTSFGTFATPYEMRED